MTVASPLPIAPSIEGIVRSAAGRPVAGAQVLVHRELVFYGTVPDTGRTDGEGRFKIPVETPGEYSLAVDAPGFAPKASLRARTGSPVPIVLDVGRTLAGVVRDGVSGRPVAGARVGIRGPGFALDNRLDAGLRETRTDGSGRYRLEHAPESGQLFAMARGYSTSSTTVDTHDAGGDLALYAGAFLAGRVTSSTGAAIPGAVVTASGYDAPHEAGTFGRGETDANGRFEIIGLEPGLFRVSAYRPGLAPGFAAAVRLAPTATVEIALPEPTAATGRLVDERGQPLPGAIWMEALAGGYPPGGGALRATAGSDGRFRLDDLPPGTHRAGVFAAGHRRRSLEVRTREGASSDLGEIALESGEMLRGRVRQATGEPVQGARVDALSLEGGGGFATAISGDDGAFVLAGLAPGRYRLALSVSGSPRGTREARTGEASIDWRLPPTGAVSGEVVDASGRVVEEFRVIARPVGEEDRAVSVSSRSGAFELAGLAPGRYMLEAFAGGHAEAVVGGVLVSAGRVTAVGRIRLGALSVVRGVVADASGRPAAGALVRVRSRRDEREGSLGATAPAVRTAADGRFELIGVPAGGVTLEATHPRLGNASAAGLRIAPDNPPLDVRLTLKPGGRLQGFVRRRGAGIAAVVSTTSLGELRSSASTATEEEDGSFALENLPGGPTLVHVRAVSDTAPSLLLDRQVFVREAETTTLELELRDTLVAGRVTRNGQPASGLIVAVDAGGSRGSRRLDTAQPGPQPMIARSGADGSYALLVPEPGAYVARVEAAEGALLHSRPVDIARVDEQQLDLDFSVARVTGVLVDEATGQPVANGEISTAETEEGALARQVRSGNGGHFELWLERGPHTLVARAAGYAAVRRELPVESLEPRVLRIELPRGFVLRGRVVDASGQGAPSLLVIASGERQREDLAHAETALDGSFELAGLTEARYNLLAGSDLAGFAVLPGVSEDAGELRLVLREPGRVRLHVVDGSGGAVAGAFAVITGVDGAQVLGLPSFFALTDAEGLVELSAPPGEVELTVQTPSGRSSASTVRVTPGEISPATVEIAADALR